jgi:hypothetical protein
MRTPFALSSAIDKVVAILVLVVIVPLAYPQIVAAAGIQNAGENALVFTVEHSNQIQSIKNSTNLVTAEELALADPEYQYQLAFKEQLHAFFVKRNSPLADCVDTIVAQENMDKILALANAEGGFRHYKNNNMWGVGGSKLWKLGDTLCEGVVGMNDFLENYPRRAVKKYADQTFDEMNCVYKQPCGNHWVKNNKATIKILDGLRAEARKIAMARISAPVQVAGTADIELAIK